MWGFPWRNVPILLQCPKPKEPKVERIKKNSPAPGGGRESYPEMTIMKERTKIIVIGPLVPF